MTRSSSGVVLLAVAAACGSRSHLLEPGAAGSGAQAGVAGSVGGTSFGGSGGTSAGGAPSGGAPAGGTGGGLGGFGGSSSCDGLFLAGEIVKLKPPQNITVGGPLLSATSDDAQQLSVAFISESPSSSAFRQLTHATFSAWLGWPSPGLDLAHTTFASSELSTRFAVSSALGNRMALLVGHIPQGAPQNGIVSFAPSADPLSTDVGPNVTLSSQGEPVFAAPGPAGFHLVAASNGTVLMGHVVKYSGMSFSVNDVLLACGLGASVADAVPYQQGWLVALANEKTAPPTGCSAAANGGTRLDVVRVGLDGSVAYVTGIENATPITRIAMAPHPDGAWVTWRVASGGLVAPLMWVRVDVPSAGLVGPGEISQPFDYPLDGFDATQLGDRLAVVWGNDPANNPPDLTISVIDGFGTLAAQTLIEPGFFGPLAIAGAPSGNSLVVAWREGAGNGGTAIKLARFDCYGAL